MKKVDAISYILVAISVIVMVIFVVYKIVTSNVEAPKVIQNVTKRATIRNIGYVIRGERFYLINGMVTKNITQGGGSKQTIRITGVPVSGDLNGDTKKDTAVILSSVIDNGDVSYYAAFAFATGTTYTTSEAMYLGTNITVGGIEVHEGNAIYTYTETIFNEQKAATTSITKSIIVRYDGTSNTLGEVVKDFEGEADPSKMTLSMKKWEWIKTTLQNETVLPKKSGVFLITLNDDKAVIIKTDCNAMIGRYNVDGNMITFSEIASTKMYCEGAQEQLFSEMINSVKQFRFTSRGELVLELQEDKGTMIFR